MKAKRILKKLNYLPRWAWYLASLFIVGLIGPLFVYLGFHALDKMAKDQEEEESFGWDVDIDDRGVHVRDRSARAQGSASSVYQDEECTVTSDEDILTQWERAEQSAKTAQQSRHAAAPAYEDTAKDGESAPSDDVRDVVREGREAMRRIRHANDLIPDPALSAQIDSIENSCGQILALLEQRPQLLKQLRTFLRYYLPTTLKLLDARAKLENTANTPKARQVRARISEALGVIDVAFQKQVEALDEYRFIDLESEMDVLRDMLRADGLVGEDKEEAPFASVMKRRSENGPATPMQTH